MEQEKKCENCKYFLLHYVKSNTKFTPMLEGHCINREISWKIRKHNMPNDNCCDKWESNEELKNERKESIKTVIKNIQVSLKQIQNILLDD